MNNCADYEKIEKTGKSKPINESMMNRTRE
jgi:hypothetical protein